MEQAVSAFGTDRFLLTGIWEGIPQSPFCVSIDGSWKEGWDLTSPHIHDQLGISRFQARKIHSVGQKSNKWSRR